MSWNRDHPTFSWAELVAELKVRMPGVRRFGIGRPSTRRRVFIDAYFDGATPMPAPMVLLLPRSSLTVHVRVHLVRRLRPRHAPRSSRPRRRPGSSPQFDLDLPQFSSGVVFTGVHAGSPFAVPIGSSRRELGAVGAILALTADATTPAYVITCGHVFPPGAKQTPIIAAPSSNAPEVQVGTLEVNLLEPASSPRLDVALVKLTPAGQAIARNSSRGPDLRDYLAADDVFDQDVRSYRPTIAGFSSATRTSAGPFHAHVDAPLWPGGFDIDGVVETLARVSIPGDSGTVLATLAPEMAAGVCSASDGDSSLFEPIGRALKVLRPSFNLSVWRKS